MPIIGALLLLILQFALFAHAKRTGRGWLWQWIIMLLPVVGSVAYIVTQVLPDLLGGRITGPHPPRLIHADDPRRELRRRKLQLPAGDRQAHVQLARECMQVGLYIEAADLLEAALGGVYAGNPEIMLLLARAQFQADDAEACVATLDALIDANPEFRSTDGHLLYARALTELGRLDAAVQEYEVLLKSCPGEQARVRFAQLLERRGERQRAQALYREALERGAQAPADYREREREWLALAEAALRGKT